MNHIMITYVELASSNDDAYPPFLPPQNPEIETSPQAPIGGINAILCRLCQGTKRLS